MAVIKRPRNWGPNSDVTFDQGKFVRRLFETVGSEVHYTGPGPSDHRRSSSNSARHERFAVTLLAEHLFSKYDDRVSSSHKRDVAFSRFLDSEALCAITNQKFRQNSAGQDPDWLAPKHERAFISDDYEFVADVIHRARKIIQKTLGKVPEFSEIISLSDHGPGASTRLSRRESRAHNKWAGRPHVTSFSSSAIPLVFDELPLLHQRMGQPGHEIVAGNKLELVPKNYKTDRTIAIEPEWNMFLQKGYGGAMRRKLKRVKQDLDDQSVNQFLACIGSITDELSCLDLSMASDTVAYWLVVSLFSLRPDWLEKLEQLRSPIGFAKVSKGSKEELAIIFEKFSSMGNGNTFELESMIFYALIRAVSELTGISDHRCYVYGDDLVVPTEISDDVILVLRHCGFIINTDKSCVQGPYRESCGGHYFDGHDVTPFYIREPVDTLDRLFLLHNNVCRWFDRLEGIADPEKVRALLSWIRSHAPAEWQVPRLHRLDIGDGAFIGDLSECSGFRLASSKRKKRGRRTIYPYAGWEGWYTRTLNFTPRLQKCEHDNEVSVCSLCEFPDGSGPDLASLWRLEKVAKSPLVRKAAEVPYQDRWWSVGDRVLPMSGHLSWFNC